jgi:hypothetical protein
VVLYGCETWSLILREEHRLRALENRVLRRIFGLKRDKVTGGWRKLHNVELHNLYSFNYNDQFKEGEIGRACSTNEPKRNAYRTLVGKPERKSPLGRPKRRWVNNVKMDLRETEWGDMDWNDLAQNRDQWRVLVYTVTNFWLP